MQLHEIKRKTKNRKKKYIGRGGSRGKTSGKGHKGQNSRAGRKKRPELRDIIKKIPKKRGYRFTTTQQKPVAINLSTIDKLFKDGEKVTPNSLFSKNIIKKLGGRISLIKILATGELTKKIIISDCLVSESARKKIEALGGEIK
ncbi:MAG: 50S ribosomal protein L15 [Candidatus Paceibacterota bacterium]|jgi:large subunit ribosomal protein L15